MNVAGGLSAVQLGDMTVSNMTSLDASIFNDANLQLRIWFSDGTNGFAALNPPQSLTTTPYAAVARRAARLISPLPADQLGGTYFNTVILGRVFAY